MLEKYITNKKHREALEWLIVVAAAFLIFLVLRNFVVISANINGVSMEPTLSHGDKVMVNRFSYLFSKPGYRDIIAFPSKESKRLYVKRVIGLPGDIIDIADGKFIVNGKNLEDNFSDERVYFLGDVEFPVTVPENCYFVLGDNRNSSDDSRFYSVGSIPKKDIIGKVSVRIWPFDKIGLLKEEEAQ